MPVPQEILKLVERFDSQREAYQSGKYNEAQIRAEFIDPLFKALGWDVHNEQGYAEAYKDVIHEDAIKIGGVSRVATTPLTRSCPPVGKLRQAGGKFHAKITDGLGITLDELIKI